MSYERRSASGHEILPLRVNAHLSPRQILGWTLIGAALAAVLAFLVTFGLGPTAPERSDTASQPTGPSVSKQETSQASQTVTPPEPVVSLPEKDRPRGIASEPLISLQEASPLSLEGGQA